jgi:hypothetical protein
VELLAGIVGLAALALAPAAAVPPPARPGPWHQLGAAATSRPGKAVHSYRTAANPDPQALALVVTSASSRPIRGTWWSYCEEIDDDTAFEDNHGRLAGVRSVTVYPPMLERATRCYVSFNVRALGKARVSVAVFAY